MSPILLGLVAPSGSGKSTVAKHLREAHGFISCHAGMPVKLALKKGFKVPMKYVDGKAKRKPAEEFDGHTPKEVLDHMGHAIATLAPGATSHQLRKTLKGFAKSGYPRVVVDGVRQPSEADTIRQMGGKIVRIDRGAPVQRDLKMDQMSQRIKEDFNVSNTKGKRHAKEQLDQIIKKLGG